MSRPTVFERRVRRMLRKARAQDRRRRGWHGRWIACGIFRLSRPSVPASWYPRVMVYPS